MQMRARRSETPVGVSPHRSAATASIGSPRVIEAAGFSQELIEALAAGTIDGIRVPGALRPEVFRAATAALDHVQFSTYDRVRVFPPVARFGVSINDHRVDGLIADTYWAEVDAARREWSRLGVHPDPFEVCRRLIGDVWPFGVELGRCGDAAFSPGIIREINSGLQVHFDDANLEHTTDLFDVRLVNQFAFNLYLTVPPSGGELVIWRHRRQESDEAYLIPGSYGYGEAVVAGIEPTVIRPQVGEVILFDPRNFHTVRPAKRGRRVSIGFSVGLAETGKLVVWA